VDLPRSFTIRESSHRIHNPLTSEKLATLGQAVSPAPGTARPAPGLLSLALPIGSPSSTATHRATSPISRSASFRALAQPGSAEASRVRSACCGAASPLAA
jgi:hypothetical protein